MKDIVCSSVLDSQTGMPRNYTWQDPSFENNCLMSSQPCDGRENPEASKYNVRVMSLQEYSYTNWSPFWGDACPGSWDGRGSQPDD